MLESSFLCKYYYPTTKAEQMLYLTSFHRAMIFSITQLSKYLTTSLYSTYLSWKMSCFSSHLAQTDNIVNQVRRNVFLLYWHSSSANFTGRYIWNGCLFDSLFFHELQLSSTLQQLLFQKTYSLFSQWLLTAQIQYRNIDKGCEEIPRQGKELHESEERQLWFIKQTN